ncbi:hypothetical protein [Virgibacillus phage Mimir87]|nr:hypothetical protein [Virgibacillus phage Mimir87]
MHKPNKLLYGFVLGISFIYIIHSVYISVKYMESVEKLEHQQQIIEALQQENASLHDSVWHLNQALEGESK